MIYYRRYVGSYLKNTSRLSLVEHGAYTALLDHYYAEEKPLPLDLDKVYRMARAMMPEERRAVDVILTTYFDRREDGYHNQRADEELAIAAKMIDTARENGKLGGRPKKNPEITGEVTEGITGSETGSITQTEPVNNHPSTYIHQPTTDILQLQPSGKALPSGAGQILPSNIPYKEIVELYHRSMDKLPKVRTLGNDRRKLIRLAWQASKGWQKLDFWKAYFEECAEDDFLNGVGPYRGEHANWSPTFDYLMRPKVVTRTYEKAMHRIEQAA